ncbi:unnamed protein product [Acidithrix sp. C25]|nr:unnamed protein product [Acidithrix sp. C25]
MMRGSQKHNRPGRRWSWHNDDVATKKGLTATDIFEENH